MMNPEMTTPAGQRWTRDKPTVAGWYWLRRVGGVTVVEVISVPGYEPKHWIVEGVNLRWSLGNMDGEWLGPITPTDDAALRRAKAEVLELAARELCMYCNDPGNWAPMSNSGYHQCNTPGPNMTRCYATKIHALKRELDARAAQIEEGEHDDSHTSNG